MAPVYFHAFVVIGRAGSLGTLVPPPALVAATVHEKGVPAVSPTYPPVPVVHEVPVQVVEVMKVCTTVLPG